MGAYTAADAAACIVDAAIDRNTPVSNLQLQKILYFSYCDFMKSSGGETLFDDAFRAWQYGPVVPDVYRCYSIYGGSPITKAAEHRSPGAFYSAVGGEIRKLDDARRESVIATTAKWCNVPAWDLVAESHDPNGAWYKVYNVDEEGAGYNQVIPLDLIRETIGL